MNEIADYGATKYPGRFGIMNAQLKATSTALTGSSNALIEDYHSTNPTAFQCLTSAQGFGGHDLGGTLQETLEAGLAIGPPNWIEVYQNDAKNPDYATLLEWVSSQLVP